MVLRHHYEIVKTSYQFRPNIEIHNLMYKRQIKRRGNERVTLRLLYERNELGVDLSLCRSFFGTRFRVLPYWSTTDFLVQESRVSNRFWPRPFSTTVLFVVEVGTPDWWNQCTSVGLTTLWICGTHPVLWDGSNFLTLWGTSEGSGEMLTVTI